MRNKLQVNNLPIIVFSHLRWEFVTQRPQHIISRLAQSTPVLFIEEPIHCDPEEHGTANMIQVQPNITVMQPKFHPDYLMDELELLIKSYEFSSTQAPLLWFYSAAFHELADRLPNSLIVYDCMDELSAFKGASAQLVSQELALLKKADLVFTGGKSLYHAKKPLNEAVYCYPSSVDRDHFEKANMDDTLLPEDIKNIPHPIVGYYGVIDERIDYDLLSEVAKLNPSTSFVMIGPIVKVKQTDLPCAENLYYLGAKAYEELPSYLKAFDIAMMPFALNESTRFISPTKTLEYIAAEKPVISTPITDVVRDYRHVSFIVKDASDFSIAILDTMEEVTEIKKFRLRQYNTILDTVSWDKTVASMQQNITEARRNAWVMEQPQEMAEV